jgi:hypothetical protein
LEEIHFECYGNHASSRTLVVKAFRFGYYWPPAFKDAEELVRHCKGCQFFAKQAHVPAHNVICIPPSWPFSCWGLDVVGPLKHAPGGFKYIYVAIDKFTKWIEYKPLVKLNATKAVEFMQDIMYRFACLIGSSQISACPLRLSSLEVGLKMQHQHRLCLCRSSSSKRTSRAG